MGSQELVELFLAERLKREMEETLEDWKTDEDQEKELLITRHQKIRLQQVTQKRK